MLLKDGRWIERQMINKFSIILLTVLNLVSYLNQINYPYFIIIFIYLWKESSNKRVDWGNK